MSSITAAHRIRAFLTSLDNSYSVDEDDEEGSLLNRARQKMSFLPDARQQYRSRKDAEDDIFPDEQGIRSEDGDEFSTRTEIQDTYERV